MLAFHLVGPILFDHFRFGRSGVPRVAKSQMATRLSRARGLGYIGRFNGQVTPVREWDDDHSAVTQLRLGDLFTISCDRLVPDAATSWPGVVAHPTRKFLAPAPGVRAFVDWLPDIGAG